MSKPDRTPPPRADTPQHLRDQATASGETHFTFQAEVARLLHLMVHSVYAQKDVFLRELISNAADACDKLRYEAVTRPQLLDGDPDLRITLAADKERGILSLADNGIGMGRDELIENLGTIARSGTKAFLDRIGDSNDPGLIGQFGVGFYSAFMVADRVEVLSRRAGERHAYLWSSEGKGEFTVDQTPGDIMRGTEVRLHIKTDMRAVLEDGELARIVRTYSDHIAFPINLQHGGEGEAELRQLNTASALWTRPKGELDESSYREFYHHVAGSFDAPALTIHYRVEGRHEYTVLLFVPSLRPFDLYDPSRRGRIKLYVRRVFITDEAEMLPGYLRFLRGVVDSADMPLNISREMLQNNPTVGRIRKAVANRVLSELEKLSASDAVKFEEIWRSYGAVLKEGLYEDPERREQIFALARFRSTASADWRTLKDYLGRLRPNQTAIHYITGQSLEQLRGSPQLEGFRARGVEVLLLSDPIDHFWVTTVPGHEGKPFRSVTQGEADLALIPLAGATAPDAPETPEAAALIGRLKALLIDHVGDVRRSARLVDSPACLVAPAGGPDRGLDKLLERQTRAGGVRPVLEVNLAHPLVKALTDPPADEADAFEDLAWLLLDEARILDGEAPVDPAKLAARINRLVLGEKS